MPKIYTKDVKGVILTDAELLEYLCFTGTGEECRAWLDDPSVDLADFVVDYSDEAPA